MRHSTLLLVLILGGCAAMPEPRSAPAPERTLAKRAGHSPDLLTAGLGAAGLAAIKAPEVNSDPAGRRQLAYYNNWRGIADLSPQGGYGVVYGSPIAAVPGYETSAWLGEVGLFSPHGVLVHIPDSFDPDRPCVIVAPVSGSRGIYGAMATSGAWALSRGCAVVYTDKGAGSGFYDLDANIGLALDGEPVAAGPQSGFHPEAGPAAPAGLRGIAIKHAHSQDNPEASWGRMTLSAARFALLALEERFPGRRFDAANTRVIAASISNGGGAVLHALEADQEGLIDGVVAAAPQITVPGATSLLDYSLQAALLAPCAQLLPQHANTPLAAFLATRGAEFSARCANLAAKGWVQGPNLQAQARSAHARLRAIGFSEGALANNATNVVSDLWRALGVTYLQSYARAHVDERICGYRFAPIDATGQPRAASDAERGGWFANASGIAPTAGVQVISPPGAVDDPAFAGLWCLREAYESEGALGTRIHAGIAAVRASALLPDRPVLIIHGREDGLIPVGASARAYVEAALRQGARQLSYWEIEHAQHFDAFLGQPAFGERYVPLLAYFYQGLDQMMAHLDGGPAPAPSQLVRTQRRGLDASGSAMPLSRDHLGKLRADPGADAITLKQERLHVPD